MQSTAVGERAIPPVLPGPWVGITARETDVPDEDTAMATGNDEAEPGEHRSDDGPLRSTDQALLAELADPGAPADGDAVEDTPAAARAVDEGSVLPVGGQPAAGHTPEDEALTPRFQEPAAG